MLHIEASEEDEVLGEKNIDEQVPVSVGDVDAEEEEVNAEHTVTPESWLEDSKRDAVPN